MMARIFFLSGFASTVYRVSRLDITVAGPCLSRQAYIWANVTVG